MTTIRTSLLLCFLTSTLLASAIVPDSTHVIRIGDRLPDFEYCERQDLFEKSSQLLGKVLVINFFATWCGPCQKELPHLETEIWEPFRDRSDFKLLVFGRGHTQAELLAFSEKQKISLPLIPDPQQTIYSLFARQYIPRLYLIDRQGKVVQFLVGFNPAEFEQFKIELDKQLKQITQ